MPSLRPIARAPKRADVGGVLAVAAVVIAAVAPLCVPGTVALLDWSGGTGQGWRFWATGVIGQHMPAGPLVYLFGFVGYPFGAHAAAVAPFAGAAIWAATGLCALADQMAVRANGWRWGPRVAACAIGVLGPFWWARQAAGQVGVLCGVGGLAWMLAVAVRAVRDDRAGSAMAPTWAALALTWALAAAGSVHYVWVGAVIAVGVVAVRALGRLLGVGEFVVAVVASVAAVGVTCAWAVPNASRAASTLASTDVHTFATRPSGMAPAPLAAVVGAGFWRAQAHDLASTLGVLWPAVIVIVAAVAVAGLIGVSRRVRRFCVAVWVVGVIGALGAAWPAGLYRVAYEQVPGFAMMRETGKWSVLAALVVAAGVAAAVAGAGKRRTIAATVVAGMAFTSAAAMFAYSPTIKLPAEWSAVAAEVRSAELCGRVAVAPADSWVLTPGTQGRLVGALVHSQLGSCVVADEAAADEFSRGDFAAVRDRGYVAVVSIAGAELPQTLGHTPGARLAGGPDVTLWALVPTER